MRWGLFTTKLVIVLFNLGIVVILILSVLPLVQGGLNIEMPQNDSQWTYNDNILSMQTPIQIYNGGFFDIQNFTLGFELRNNGSSEVLVSSQTAPVDIVHGRWTNIPLAFDIDLENMNRTTERELVFNDTSFNLSVSVQAQYTDRMITLGLNGYNVMNWTALIYDLNVDTSELNVESAGSNYTISVPYHFSASNILSGAHVDLGVRLRDPTMVMGNSSKEMTIQENNDGTFNMSVNETVAHYLMSHTDKLYVDYNVSFDGATFGQTSSLEWGPFHLEHQHWEPIPSEL